MADLTPGEIRELCMKNPKMRDRDLAEQHGLTEAQLVAAFVGQGTKRVVSHPDDLMEAAHDLGEVMALTRNAACVHEKIGTYDNYHPGAHAAMVLTDQIDLRIFPSHWVHAFMVEKEAQTGLRRSIQIFDAAGDAVHKIFLRDHSDLGSWDRLKSTLAINDQSQQIDVVPRKPVEAAKSDPAKVDILRKEWGRLTDTHQFLRLTSKLKMNRLGAYRIAGAPFVTPVRPASITKMLEALAERETEVMIFVGNKGCIQIHTGPIKTLKPMGPWQNVMDAQFSLHLRQDHVAEVWAVEKPTQRGPALSVEAFDAQGMLIFQVFGISKEGRDSRAAWSDIVAGLDSLQQEPAA
ncbi:hemin-degrading factor [Actibacterium sp. 188UL27-1]|uniref:hemin-degrading factor n=1 Tax=Actibacterium sp. 188UL27-1 TaxID=2786961 RepID=UPI00195C00B6|nr:ChuX/HutX family heme-like substrate-binding protein [Actibacterium sp. 188UL27-1]MBM7067093.1 hemin-degrading factor [Actibacterium sp. 188UL27-1]